MALANFTIGRLRASLLNLLVAGINSLNRPTWQSYGASGTVLTSSGTNPTLGNSTFAFAYRQTTSGGDLGDLVIARGTVTIGSTFSAGTGNYKWLLPVAASSGAQAASVGVFWINDNGTAFRAGSVIFADSTHVELHPHNGTGGPYGAGGPGTAWASGDVVRFQIEYEPA